MIGRKVIWEGVIMQAMKRIKRLLLILAILVFLWLVMIGVDFFRIQNNSNPIFCFHIATYDDGNSLEYLGLGYKVFRVQTDPNFDQKTPIMTPFWESFETVQVQLSA